MTRAGGPAFADGPWLPCLEKRELPDRGFKQGAFWRVEYGAHRIAPPPFRFNADIAYEPGHSSAPICCRFPYVGFIVGHHTLSPSDMRRPAA